MAKLNRFLIIFAIIIILIIASNYKKPKPLPVTITPIQYETPLVATYFYYWYDLPNGAHSLALTDHPADNASYKNVEWFKKQLTDMNEAGIDIVLADYWGSVEPSSSVGLSNLAIAARQMEKAPKIAMFFDTGIFGTWQDRDLRKQNNKEKTYQLIHTFYTILPKTQWALINGKPIIWFWAPWFDGLKYDRTFFDYIKSSFQADFGVEPYIIAEKSWQNMPLDDYYEWGASLWGYHDVGGIAEVGPGYDERQLTGSDRTGRYTDRENGAFYERNLQAAVDSGKKLLVIETWNEFHEASDIADSQEYGRKYIAITKRYADDFKS